MAFGSVQKRLRPCGSVMVLAALPLSVMLIANGCGERSAGEPGPMPASLQVDAGELNALKTISHESVTGLAVPADIPFFVKTRKKHINQFPCSECHQGALIVAPPPEAQLRKMHVDIRLEHAREDVMQCATCHDATNMDSLKSLEVHQISMDHAYRVCFQCHFEQVKDWAGGAHGKRLAGWRGKRVVMNCTECHDPHKPAIPARLPVAFPSMTEEWH